MSHDACSKAVSIELLIVVVIFSSCSNIEKQFCELRAYFPITPTVFRNTHLAIEDPRLSLEALCLSHCVLHQVVEKTVEVTQ